MNLHHFLLTRFNLHIWSQDKTQAPIDWYEWLCRRMALFERYCLPSVKGQTCGEFTWVLLVDTNTPPAIMERLRGYKDTCPQIHLVRVMSEYGTSFVEIFAQVVAKLLRERKAKVGDLCLTTYFDNDDSLANDFVAQVQRRSNALVAPCFLSFDYGLQVYSELEHFTTLIRYPNNHFLSLAEPVLGEAFEPVTCYGYGSHFYVERRGLARVEHVSDAACPMWVELIHHENVDNDVKMTLRTSIVTDRSLLRRRFSLAIDIHPAHRISFAQRAVGQMWRRMLIKLSLRRDTC